MSSSPTTEAFSSPTRLRRPALRVGPVARDRLAVWVPPIFVALLTLPFIVSQNIWWEWQVPYWMLERQTEHVAAHGTPTFFLHLGVGAFTPVYLFYGGATLSLLAYPAVIFGPWAVYVASVVAAMVAGYLGVWWTARNLGLSRSLAVLPGLAFATAPYMMAELYGRGAWSEQLGANAAAVVLGGVTAKIFRPDAHPRGSTAALVAAGAVLAGTHNLSLLMAGVLLPLMVVALLPLAPWAGGALGVVRGVLRAVVALAVGAGLTAAWLIPNIWWGPKTYISSSEATGPVRDQQAWLTNAKNLLSPWPRIPEDAPGRVWLYVQSPMMALAWAVVALVVVLWLRRRRPASYLLATVLLAALGTALMLLIVNIAWWPQLPRLVQVIQFSLRLIPYFVLVVALGVIVALRGLPSGRPRRILVPVLIGATVVQAAIAVAIAHDSKGASNHPEIPLLKPAAIHAADEPILVGGQGFIFPYQFRIVHSPSGAQPAGPPFALTLDDAATADVATVGGAAKVGDVRGVYLSWSPFIRMDGDAELVGYDEWGQAVVRVDHVDRNGRFKATVRARCTTCLGALSGRDPWQLLAGRAVSAFSALVVVATLGLWLLQAVRRHRGS